MIRAAVPMLVLLLALGASAQTNPGAPPLVFEPAQMDLGVLGYGESATGSVMVRNIGDVPVTIARTIASCACTYTKDIAGAVLAPGEAVKLEGTLTPKPGLGPKTEKISVIADGYDQYAVVYIQAEVALPVRSVPGRLDALQSNAGEYRLVAQDGRPFRVFRANGRPPVFVGFDPARDPPRSEYTLRFDVNGYTHDTIPWYWVTETDHPDAPVVDARIMHDWTRNPSIKPRWIKGEDRILGGVLRRGDTFEFKTKLKYHPRVIPDDGVPVLRALTPGISAVSTGAETVGTEILLRGTVTVLEEGPGLLYEKIEMSHGGYSEPFMFFAQLAEGGAATGVDRLNAVAVTSSRSPAILAGGAIGLAVAVLVVIWLLRRRLQPETAP